MQITPTPWWRTDIYDAEQALLPVFDYYAGPKGPALVRAWPDETTDPGWGLNPPKNSSEGFMPRYMRGAFDKASVLFGYEQKKWNFAIVMRSLKMVCIDIDGKNGGFDGAKQLGMLPLTLAEVSKSGNGYHLFYLVVDEWDDEKGFGLLGDRIGIEQGVDIRATGCVYHHPQQRWNHRAPAMLPDQVKQHLLHRDQKVAAAQARITSVLASNDEVEVLMLHDELMTELNKPIPAGKRNNTLFAIGNKMKLAQVPDWEEHVERRAMAVGLDADETDKLVRNISTYGPATP